ncbi:deoxycytidylate deaminase [Nitzschia inconspicua]|uniref:dCMP deaminase n=1 Tax=Nitzschia inconspicua TaxID=303405 RepID=A0A9K3KFD4_9STRA|nr:deoxycytidylate deaminase [Nitzschia inconspicua]
MSHSYVPSSTTKRLLPAFESQNHNNNDRDISEGSDAVNVEWASDSTTPRPNKYTKLTSTNLDIKEPKETTSLPHETPIGKYLPLSRLPPKVSQDEDVEVVTVTPKRQGYLDWDDYFLGIAILSSKRSKDPDHAEGACIVDQQNRIVAIGYSGFPKGCPDTIFPWVDFHKGKQSNTDNETVPWLHSKQPFLCPAITNAILNKCSPDVAGCRLYVMEFPSADCVKVMIQSGIRELVILKPAKNSSCNHHNKTSSLSDANVGVISDDEQASRIMLEMANIHVRYHKPAIPSLTLDLSVPKQDEPNNHPIDACCSSKTQSSNPSSDDSYTLEEQTAIAILQEEADYDATAVSDNGRRHDYLTWDEYFMSVAFLTAQRSKDPNTQVGACIVDDEHRIIGLGYNGMPRGLSDDAMPWSRDSSNPPIFNKYLYVTHAEVNAILNKGSANVKGSTIYVALFPCENCAKMIIQSGIRRVIYLSDRYHDTDGCRASRIMLKCAKVELVQWTPSQTELTILYDGDMSAHQE